MTGPKGLNNLYLFSGEFYETVEDLWIKGRGLDFIWTRKYRSRIGPNSAQGNGWDFSYNISILQSGQNIELRDGNGRSDVYSLQPDGTFARDEFFQVLSRNSDGTFTLLFSDTSTWNFHALDGSPRQGKVSRISDRNNNSLLFTYDPQGRLVVVTDTLQRDIRIAYNAQGLIGSVTDFTGRQVKYNYYRSAEPGGSRGDLKSVTSAAVTGTPQKNDFPDGQTTSYTYSKGFSNELLNHNLLTITDPKGQTYLRNIYSSSQNPDDLNFDRVTRQAWGNPTDTIEVVYVRLRPSAENQSAVVKSIVNDRVGNVKEYFYDPVNRVVMHRSFTGRALPGRPTSDTDNRPARRLRLSDPAWFETRYEWNVDSQPTRIIHPNGDITERVYELGLNPRAPRRSRGNLRLQRHLPARLGGDQPERLQSFEYETNFGGCCGSNFVTKATDARGKVSRYTYDKRGNLTHLEDRASDAVEDFEYNDFGQLIQHTHPDNGSNWRRIDRFTYYLKTDGPQHGYRKEEIIDARNSALTTRYQYDAVGNTTQIQDPRGNSMTYVYNQLNRIVRESSRPARPGGPSYQTDILYDANGNVIRKDYQNIDEKGELQANTHFTTTHQYEILNHRIRTRKEIEPNRFANIETVYDPNRNVVLKMSGEATSKRQPNNVVRIKYDERGLPFQKVRAPGDRDQSTRQYDYDGNGNRIRMIMGLEDKPREFRYSYDGFNRLTRMLDPIGNTHDYSYDPNGNAIRARISGELGDLGSSRSNKRLLEEVNTYDDQDRLTRSERLHFDPRTQTAIGDGKATVRKEYNANSQITRLVNDNGAETRFLYDTANRERQIFDAKGNKTTKTYDPNSNLIEVEEEEIADLNKRVEKFKTKYEYDGLDRVIRRVDNEGNVTSYAYDSRDNLKLVVDPLSNVIRLEYDGLKRLTHTRRALNDPEKGSRAIVISQIWDDNSRLSQRRDGNGNITRYTYDALDRETSLTYMDRTVHSYTYDVHDNQKVMRDANGNMVSSVYDQLNRVIRKTIVPVAAVAGDVAFEEFSYDGMSRLVRARDNDSLVTLNYDSLSYLTRETLNGQTTSCTHDALGNKRSCTYPGGRIVKYTYDDLNQIVKVSDSQDTIADFDYAGPQRLERRRYLASETNQTSLYSYDANKRMTGFKHSAGDKGEVIDARRLEWDAMHNKTVQLDLRPGGPQLKHTYSYDSINRLSQTSVKDSSGTAIRDTKYDLDSVGNRLKVTGDKCPGPYTMSARSPEPADHQVNQYTTTGCDSRSYDRNGNLVRIVSSDGEVVMTYDYRNQMRSQTKKGRGGNLLVAYSYDALGRRIAKTIGTQSPQTTKVFYNDGQMIEEQDGRGTTIASYVYGQHPNDVLTMRRGKIDFYYHSDDLRSVSAVADEAGKVVERYSYDDFGRPAFFNADGKISSSSAIGNSHLFTGQLYDAETGLYYYRTRYFDPGAGRFTTRDRIGIWGDAANLGNGFSYAANSPASLVDTKGESIERSISCNGPWPGPRVVVVEYEGCGSTRRQALDVPICRGFRASGQANRDVLNLWNEDFTGVDLPGTLPTRAAVARWFGGLNQATNLTTKAVVTNTFGYVFGDAYLDNDIDIDCESGCDPGVNAYVAYGGWDVNLCNRFFSASVGFSHSQRAGIIIHELTHAYDDTDDYFYYWQVGNDPTILPFTDSMLRENADTYMMFVLESYLP